MLTLLATLKVKPGKEVEVTEICTQLAKEVLGKEKDSLKSTRIKRPSKPMGVQLIFRKQPKSLKTY
ncbi:hypothetical protein [Desulfosporosinus sp. HMP52]|uniref:hypothetical protein n=1 Tax=Desulfosporosinus sp. HMP52 TaxID=1487923 RepID=UPI000A6B258D|nr:hypothetical protein [Desulfosporosinus sp. HMP52]